MLNVATSSRHAVVTAPSLLPPAQLRGRCSLPWSFRTAQSTRRRTGGLPASRRSKLHSMIYMICISTWSESRSLARCIQCASLGTGEECSVTLLLCRTTMHPRRLGHWESSHSAISGSLPTHQTVTAHVFVRVRGSSARIPPCHRRSRYTLPSGVCPRERAVGRRRWATGEVNLKSLVEGSHCS